MASETILPVSDDVPRAAELTAYDRAHARTYLRLLDADAEGAPWEDAARIILGRDPAQNPATARRCYDAHLARARWVSSGGYERLLRPSK